MRKSPLKMNLDERKSILIQSCFLETADMDYLTARWAYDNGIFQNFYWSGAQCVEKYLKAALLYNGRSVKKFGHDLNRLFAAVGSLDPSFLGSIIEMPHTTGTGRDVWDGEPMSLFVDYLNRYGSTHARYSLEGTFINGPVIHPLDSLCALSRGLSRYRNFLTEDLFRWSKGESDLGEGTVDCGWMVSSDLLLERLFTRTYQVGQAELLRDTFRNMNFAFFEERSGDETTFGGQHFSLAPLLNHLLRLREIGKTEENIRVIDELRVWASDNMQLPREVMRALDSRA